MLGNRYHSYMEDKIMQSMLKENPNVTIELSAHCDYRGNAAYNLRLSQRRAESVVKYLTEHGIEADRLTAKGYGKEQPKIVNRKLTETYPFLHEGDTLSVPCASLGRCSSHM